jgi:hypothetical protein
MRSRWASLVFSLLSLGVIACGGTSKVPDSAGVHGETAVTAAASQTTPGGPYLNDGDKDPSSDEDPDDLNGKKIDDDNDYLGDHAPTQNNSYHDSDDHSIVSFGHPASAAGRQAVTAVVKRYQAVAAAADGAAACSLMYSRFAAVVPEDYGQAPGPAYLRGDTTCSAVMSALFKHSHGELTRTFDVSEVRVARNQGFALLGSGTAPASYLDVRRERGIWKVDALTAVPLP